ncbi:hypothetical protein YTPLAS73_09380 [Nitrosarchaeum sp.]|nr:hypothetical protein YTPLAS73_09380 [Nitrosarchaeum sp.]
MNGCEFPRNTENVQLQEQLETLIEQHKQKCKLYENARKNKNIEMINRLYEDTRILWKSIEDTKKEIIEYRNLVSK